MLRAWRRRLAPVLAAALMATPTALAAAPAGRMQPAAAPAPAAGVATAVIRFYQGQLSALRQGHCRFTPSCSQYAIEAIGTYGVFAGSTRAADRLMRCGPSAERLCVRGADGRLADPPGEESPGPVRPRMPDWLLPAPTLDIVPGYLDSTRASPDSTKTRWAGEIVSFATALAAEGDCDRAATEYRRVAHLLGPSFSVWSHLRSGDCRFKAAEWTAAELEYRLAGSLAPAGADRATSEAMAAACRFNEGDFAACATLLAPLAADRPRPLAGLGLCDMSRGRWGAAEARLLQASRALGDSLQAHRLGRLAAWCERAPWLPRRDPRLASALSVVLPGSGQMYAGRASEGLRHLIFNGALLWTIASLARDGHYPAAYLVTGLEVPFYLGNVHGAGRSAREFNAAKRLRFVSRAIEDAESNRPR
jgi:putative membrane protein insertion efficiency factor